MALIQAQAAGAGLPRPNQSCHTLHLPVFPSQTSRACLSTDLCPLLLPPLQAQPKDRCGWELSQLSQLRFAQLFYDNAWLRRGLGLLGLRLREEGDADGAVVCSMGGHQYVYTAFGAGLWHDTMQAVIGSLEAACGLEVHWTMQPPRQAQGEQESDDQAPAAWQLRRVDLVAGQRQQGA